MYTYMYSFVCHYLHICMCLSVVDDCSPHSTKVYQPYCIITHKNVCGTKRTDPNLNFFIPDTDLAFPAHMAAASGDISHLRMLIEQGVVNINEKDDKGSTPAHRGWSKHLPELLIRFKVRLFLLLYFKGIVQ